MTSAKQRLKKRGPIQATTGDSEEQPIIAWEDMSIMDTLDMLKKDDEANFINVLAIRVQHGTATPEEWEKFQHLRSPEFQMGVIDFKCECMAKYVVSVPRSWFSSSAPEKLDFDSSDTYKHLQPKRFRDLVGLLSMTNNQAEAASGN